MGITWSLWSDIPPTPHPALSRLINCEGALLSGMHSSRWTAHLHHSKLGCPAQALLGSMFDQLVDIHACKCRVTYVHACTRINPYPLEVFTSLIVFATCSIESV